MGIGHARTQHAYGKRDGKRHLRSVILKNGQVLLSNLDVLLIWEGNAFSADINVVIGRCISITLIRKQKILWYPAA
jgi:hypothetical protein